MEYLTAAILSGLIYDGVKNGATIGYELLKSKLQGWIVDENQINRIVEQLKEAGVNEDLAPHAIERRISEHQPLTDLLKQIPIFVNSPHISQISNVGHNINTNDNAQIHVGDIVVNKGNE
ncbi:hypothetical protein L5M37_13440 [Shewanella sp. SM69]|uniref:GapS6a family protein n=1 Tax=Shewanella TaxID=22 RepID=UPI0021D9B8EF|nr:hypothetical protein [Shewanella sp. SM69]MCU8039471.1 hypothetical protein [Shewanella sp. SM69]